MSGLYKGSEGCGLTKEGLVWELEVLLELVVLVKLAHSAWPLHAEEALEANCGHFLGRYGLGRDWCWLRGGCGLWRCLLAGAGCASPRACPGHQRFRDDVGCAMSAGHGV